MAKVKIASGELQVIIEGWDKVLSLKTKIEIPLTHVVIARADPEAVRGGKGLKSPGARIPGLVTAGSFRKKGEWTFYDVHHDPQKTLVIELDHERYKRLVLDVDDPESTADAINAAIA